MGKSRPTEETLAPLSDSVAKYYENIEELDRIRRYKGIPMICVEGLHELVHEIAVKYVDRGQQILDVGCGRGAFALRMADAGYKADACDILDHCMCKDHVNFFCVSAEEARFDKKYAAIFLLEILEHTDSPFSVVRQYAKHLEPGGYLIVSTPNVDSSISRSWFMLSGRHWYFEDINVKSDGHINPIHDFQLNHIFAELDLEQVERASVHESRVLRFGIHWLTYQLLQAYQSVKRIPRNNGPATVTVVRKAS